MNLVVPLPFLYSTNPFYSDSYGDGDKASMLGKFVRVDGNKNSHSLKEVRETSTIRSSQPAQQTSSHHKE
jgi:hypothetical protein